MRISDETWHIVKFVNLCLVVLGLLALLWLPAYGIGRAEGYLNCKVEGVK
jgi:hypothetical protein